MRILSISLFLINTRALRQIFCTVLSGDIFSCSLNCFFRDTERVGSHVGNQTHSTQFWQIDTFIQFLCCLHGAFCLESQAAGSFLLQGRCNKRRSRNLFLHAFFDFGDNKVLVFQFRKDLLCFFLVWNFHFFSLIRGQFCRELLFGAAGGKFCVDGPVLFLLKCLDFPLTVYNQFYDNRLYTTCGKSRFYCFPQERTELIAYQTVEHTAGLLRVN